MKLIIHADDFGMTPSINEAIIELCKLGTLSSTSIMANMPYSQEARQLLSIDNISLGLHATFTQGKPVSNPADIPSLLDEQGKFAAYNKIIKRVRSRELLEEQIYRELKGQYLALKNIIGEKLVFVDSHHSIHNKLSPFRKAFVKLGNEFNIHAVRTRQMHYFIKKGKKIKILEPGVFTIGKFGLKKVVVNYYYKKVAGIFKKTYHIADGMVVENKPGALDTLKALSSMSLNHDQKKTLYIVVHPAASLEGLGDSNLQQERIEEYKLMKSENFRDYIRNHPLTDFSKV